MRGKGLALPEWMGDKGTCTGGEWDGVEGGHTMGDGGAVVEAVEG